MSLSKQRVQFKHYTNLAIFMMAVIGDRYNLAAAGGDVLAVTVGDVLTYSAVAVWLEQTLLVNIELKISGWWHK